MLIKLSKYKNILKTINYDQGKENLKQTVEVERERGEVEKKEKQKDNIKRTRESTYSGKKA